MLPMPPTKLSFSCVRTDHAQTKPIATTVVLLRPFRTTPSQFHITIIIITFSVHSTLAPPPSGGGGALHLELVNVKSRTRKTPRRHTWFPPAYSSHSQRLRKDPFRTYLPLKTAPPKVSRQILVCQATLARNSNYTNRLLTKRKTRVARPKLWSGRRRLSPPFLRQRPFASLRQSQRGVSIRCMCTVNCSVATDSRV